MGTMPQSDSPLTQHMLRLDYVFHSCFISSLIYFNIDGHVIPLFLFKFSTTQQVMTQLLYLSHLQQ